MAIRESELSEFDARWQARLVRIFAQKLRWQMEEQQRQLSPSLGLLAANTPSIWTDGIASGFPRLTGDLRQVKKDAARDLVDIFEVLHVKSVMDQLSTLISDPSLVEVHLGEYPFVEDITYYVADPHSSDGVNSVTFPRNVIEEDIFRSTKIVEDAFKDGVDNGNLRILMRMERFGIPLALWPKSEAVRLPGARLEHFDDTGDDSVWLPTRFKGIDLELLYINNNVKRRLVPEPFLRAT